MACATDTLSNATSSRNSSYAFTRFASFQITDLLNVLSAQSSSKSTANGNSSWLIAPKWNFKTSCCLIPFCR